MAAPKGNTYWKLAKGFAVGVERKYSPKTLYSKAIEYFEWLDKNPLKEEKVFSNGKIIKVNKMRASTIIGFCIYAGISKTTFDNYNKDKAYVAVISMIKDLIYTQKFEGAAANLIDANIIARDLGLIDKKQTDVTTNGNDLTIDVTKLTLEAKRAIINAKK